MVVGKELRNIDSPVPLRYDKENESGGAGMKKLGKDDVIRIIMSVIILIGLILITAVLNEQRKPQRYQVDVMSGQKYSNGKTTGYTFMAKQPAKGQYSLLFKSIGNRVIVKRQDGVLYDFGAKEQQKGKDIEQHYAQVAIADSDWGKPLTIELIRTDERAIDYPISPVLVEQSEVQNYYMTNETRGFFPALFFFGLGIFSIIVGIMVNRGWELSRFSVIIGIMMLAWAIVLFDSGGHYKFIIEDSTRWNWIKHFGSSMLPLICPLFFIELERKKLSLQQRLILFPLMILLALILGGIMVGTLVFDRSFSDFENLYRVALLLSGLTGVYGIFITIRYKLLPWPIIFFSMMTILWLVMASILRTMDSPFTLNSIWNTIDIETLMAWLVMYALIFVLLSEVLRYHWEHEQGQLELLAAENRLHKLQMRSFNSQMQPHFLYNALTSIQEMTLESPEYAYKLLGDFNTYLRGSIRATTNTKLISMGEELQHIYAYVSIEQLRFGERLRMEYHIEEDNFAILPFSIQPLVENAIRHGIFGRGAAGGEVKLSILRRDDEYEIMVEDTGIGFDTDHLENDQEEAQYDSHGLKNLLFRLQKGMGATVEIESTPGVGTKIIVRLKRE